MTAEPGTGTVLITGAARGIGAATAHRLAASGRSVVLFDLAEEVAETAASIESVGGRALAFRGDVTSESDWATAIERTHAIFGPVDALVCNALATDHVPLHEMALASWQRQLDVNLTGAFHGIRACLRDLRRDRCGAIVIVSSVHAGFGLPGVPAYAATKAGLTGLTRQLATEYGGEVRVNCVLPGPILTTQWDGIPEADRAASAAETVIGRLGDPGEVAGPIEFLLGASASFVTGATLTVDGGWSITKNSS
ncbi:SDR family NAD(P)-dependent oxidoreductase [Nocardia sp. NPDC019395]|uniref:SDR family NAD(P)-dependent oxidoreductase n=1 Tax=Nocardia sp. NPDC019395 TaxID=3154686 RepID=UPI0033EF3E29